MKQTRICKLLGVRYPIFQGGMLWIATAELSAAVSNAGGFGIISPLAGMARDGDPATNFKIQIKKTRALSKMPFGVNIPLDLDYAGELIDVILNENIKTVITAAGDPGIYTALLKQKGIRVLHVVSNVSQALHAESCNVDAVIVEGVEAAAHIGKDEIPLFSLIPQVVDSISIPVVAAGGIVNAKGMVAALVLGAEGVQLGTRFVAVKENIAHKNYKQAIINSKDTDTVITCRGLIPTRNLKSPFSKGLMDLERSGASTKEILHYLGYRKNRTAQIEGDLKTGEIYGGSSSGLIQEIVTANDVIQEMVKDYSIIVKNLSKA